MTAQFPQLTTPSLDENEFTEVKLLLRENALFKWMNDDSLARIVSIIKRREYKQAGSCFVVLERIAFFLSLKMLVYS